MGSATGLLPWEVWVDTGGTFTDCLARDPDGKFHRAKVLSSSTLRGTVVRQVEARTLIVDPQWKGHPELVSGCTLRLFGTAGEAHITGFDPLTGWLHLAEPVAGVEAGAPFEIQSPDAAPILAARLVTGVGTGDLLPPLRMRLATTRGTNALLERRGTPVAFFVTRGFADLLEIGTQQRPNLFALRIDPAPRLTVTVIEVNERVSTNGTVLEPLDEAGLRDAAREAFAAGISVGAVALMNSFRASHHEERVEEILKETGFRHVSRSAELSPSMNLLERARTAVANAYLAPVMDEYLTGVMRSIASSDPSDTATIHVMTSAGGLIPAPAFHPKDSILSGPAAGVVGAVDVARGLGFERVITFDMGGTSTDVARYDGALEYTWKHGVADVELVAPALAIESVAAGGGSICSLTSGALTVGPRSAGAFPGPACYGAGGPLTITDCNLLLGRLSPDRFGIPIFPDAAIGSLDALRAELDQAGFPDISADELLEGLVQIANERMAEAIRGISLRKGYDTRSYALVAFGGAGAQHACAVAEILDIGNVLIPPDPGLLSARGLGAARPERLVSRQVLRSLEDSATWIEPLVAEMAAEGTRELVADGIPPGGASVLRTILDLRLRGQNTTLAIDRDASIADEQLFASRYFAEYGHRPEAGSIEIESVRVLVGPGSREALPVDAPSGPPAPDAVARRRARFRGTWVDVPFLDRSHLTPGRVVDGPALIADPHSTIVVQDGWTASAADDGSIVLRAPSRDAGDDRPDPLSTITSSIDRIDPGGGSSASRAPEVVKEQLFTSRFESLVEQMGEQLRRTALSVNVKERLDFSCALLNPGGELVANAPHIPVHLGALGVCVRRVAETLTMAPGDVVVTNHPGFGGSHLPDVTLIMPVFAAGDGGNLIGYVANRAHHAEIGGTRPGSMPPDARRLVEEGVVIPPTWLLHRGEPRWDQIRELLLGGPHPTRAVADNVADLRAQLAAVTRGAHLLRELVAQHGGDAVTRYMDALTDRSERLARLALQRIGTAELRADDELDDGTPLRVAIRVADGKATFDFGGSGAVHPGNLNATPAIVRSVVLYVLRLLIDEPVPLNEGLLRPVTLEIPVSLLNPPFTGDPGIDPAVVGGNTELSQKLAGMLLHALRLSAGSQGTMNNVLWGNRAFGYYETIGGGAGAGPGFHGRSGVHTHMTNTRITDAEVLEHRYPVRVLRYGLRGGSGGDGEWRGGDGIVREIEFLEPVQVSLLTQNRRAGPYGMEGGSPGQVGRQWIRRLTGDHLELAAVDGCDAGPGDRLVVETPGGGGWGKPLE